jgi:hypothetical protein
MEGYRVLEENMTTKRANPWSAIGRQIRSLIHVRPSNTREQDPKTWAQVVRSHQDLPEIYERFFQSHLAMGDAFPYAVLTPTYEKFGSTISAKLICIIDQSLYVLDASAEALVESCYPIDQIHYVEVSSKLLEYRVTIHGVTNREIQTASVFRCSTVTDHLFAPILEKIRLRNGSPSESILSAKVETFDHWSERNYKFMNLARHCMLPGETVIVDILQPEIRSGLFSFPVRRIRRVKSPTHACILTERELILIREDLLQDRKDKYGSTRTFVPLDKIHSISMNRNPGDGLAMSIQLINQEGFECLFDTSLEGEVERLVARSRDWTSAQHTHIPS